MNIQFAPHLKNRSLYKDLDSLFHECTSFKASVAYWTIFPDFFKTTLTNALKKQDSFVCLDLSEPTNIYAIKSFCINGAEEFYWHKYRVRSGSNFRLLHSKVLLFDLPNGNSEIWIGSMNFTETAIKGFNVESISKINCSQTDDIYKDVLEFLNFMKNNLCFKFDINQIPYYQILNGETIQKSILNKYNGEKLKVISMFGERISNLCMEEFIVLLSFSENEFSVFKTEKRIFLHIADTELNKNFLFEGTVDQVGKIEQGKTNLDFIGDKRYAYIGLSDICYLEKPTNITHSLQKNIKYFVTLKIVQEISSFTIFEYPKIKSINVWENDDTNSYLNLMNISENDDIYIDVAKDSFSLPELRSINLLESEVEKLLSLKDILKKLQEMKDYSDELFVLSDNESYNISSQHSIKKLTISERIVVK